MESPCFWAVPTGGEPSSKGWSQKRLEVFWRGDSSLLPRGSLRTLDPVPSLLVETGGTTGHAGWRPARPARTHSPLFRWAWGAGAKGRCPASPGQHGDLRSGQWYIFTAISLGWRSPSLSEDGYLLWKLLCDRVNDSERFWFSHKWNQGRFIKGTNEVSLSPPPPQCYRAILASPMLSHCNAVSLCPSQESGLAEAELCEPRMPSSLKVTFSLKASERDQGLPAGYLGFTREGGRMVEGTPGFPRLEQCTGHYSTTDCTFVFPSPHSYLET